jgi:hypothetical protein
MYFPATKALCMASKPTLIQFKIRIRPELRRQLERAAAKRKVPVAVEAVTRLEASFTHDAAALEQTELLEAIRTSIATTVSSALEGLVDHGLKKKATSDK